MPRIFAQWEGLADPVHLDLPGPAASLYYLKGGRLWYTMPDGSTPPTPFEDVPELLTAVTLVGPPDMPASPQHTFDSRRLHILFTWMGQAASTSTPLFLVLRSRMEELDDWLTAPGVGGLPARYGTDPKNWVVLRQVQVSNSHDWQTL